MFGPRFWLLSGLCALGSAAIVGVPTVLIPTSLFHRMTPTSPTDYAIWAISSLLVGPLITLAILYPAPGHSETLRQVGAGERRSIGGMLLSLFSVGCPICNKVVVFLLGVSGAMTLFNPLRPFLGVAAVVLLATTLVFRIRTLLVGCALPLQPQ